MNFLNRTFPLFFYLTLKAGLENVNLVICSNVSQSTFDHAKNMIEWMSDRVIQKFTQKREQPYEFKNAKAGYISGLCAYQCRRLQTVCSTLSPM